MGEKHGRWILPMKHLFHTWKVLLHAVSQRHGTNSFTSPPKEVILRILSPLKICRPRLGLNPRTLGSVASTLPLDHHGRRDSSYHNNYLKELTVEMQDFLPQFSFIFVILIKPDIPKFVSTLSVLLKTDLSCLQQLVASWMCPPIVLYLTPQT
jgi:hypothetical protein